MLFILSFQVSFSQNNLKAAVFSPNLEKELSFPNFCLEPVPGAFTDSPKFILAQGATLLASTPPVAVTPQVLGQILGDDGGVRKEIIEYQVVEGDNLWSISQNFGISIDTIVWANDIKSAMIKPGQNLLILPVSGTMHFVKDGDTIDDLAKKYKTEAEKILAFNDLSEGENLVQDEVLIIPDGKIPYFSSLEFPPTSALANLSTNNFYGQSHNYPYGQCTWWVAQKRAIPSWGNAKDWLRNAKNSGFSACEGRYCIPRSGAVITLEGHRVYGHVGYVESVKGDKVTFSEMNYIGWGRLNYRTLRVGSPLILGYVY